jgi:hypothetical protein
MAEMVMMTVSGWDEAPSLEQAAETLHVAPSALDTAFGIVLVDPGRGIFTVRVDRAALDAAGAPDGGVEGPFSDPRIAPFGPPE